MVPTIGPLWVFYEFPMSKAQETHRSYKTTDYAFYIEFLWVSYGLTIGNL